MASINPKFITDIINHQQIKIEMIFKELDLDKSLIKKKYIFSEEEITNHYHKNNTKFVLKKIPLLTEFVNEYEYFIAICNILKLKCYKYSTVAWEGPVVILNTNNYNNERIQNIKNKYKIDTIIDILNHNNIAIRPKHIVKSDKIEYEHIYNTTISSLKNEKIELIEWVYQNKAFYLDTNNNHVYTTDDTLYVGKRIYSNGKWEIVIE